MTRLNIFQTPMSAGKSENKASAIKVNMEGNTKKQTSPHE